MVLSSIILDIRGVQKFKMTAYKPEVLISQLVDEIETPFQGLPLIFGVEQLNSTIVQYTNYYYYKMVAYKPVCRQPSGISGLPLCRV